MVSARTCLHSGYCVDIGSLSRYCVVIFLHGTHCADRVYLMHAHIFVCARLTIQV